VFMLEENTLAVILAAGEGKRMKSRISKILHKACGRPIVEWVCNAANDAGIDKIVVVTGNNTEQVKDCLGDKVKYAVQERQLGTGHALMAAAEYFGDMKGSVVVLCGDVPLITPGSLKRAMETHRKEGNAVTVLTAVVDNPEGYGRIVRDSAGRIRKIVETRDASEEEKKIKEINSGTYIFDAGILSTVLAGLDNRNSQGEYYLTDTVEAIITNGQRAGAVISDDPSEILGVNDRIQLADATAILRNRILKNIMLSGVTIIDPASTYIDADVSIGVDTVIYPGTILEGGTEIGECCTIGPNTRIVNSRIGNNAEIINSVVLDSSIGEETHVGPFAYVRPNSRIGRKVRIGDFVELKNAIIGERTKISHLAYVGDAEVGSNVNIGCGVVFGNYNGKEKNRTIVGDNAFIGCNSNLIAPVVVEKDAYIAAGSTITDNVPENALAIARERQVIKENWVIKRGMKRE
jgi:bifunctional UDP-N-acetylglucosamine pyrophosphorylase/glucosamine-1-phosphate N-acetyltransferase